MELLTIDETATMLKINPETVRRHIASGRLPAVRVGRRVRVRREAVEALAEPVTPKEEPLPRAWVPGHTPSAAVLAQRRAAAEEIRSIQRQIRPGRESSAELIHRVREQERRSHGI